MRMALIQGMENANKTGLVFAGGQMGVVARLFARQGELYCPLDTEAQ
jgi:hypothetical protein